MSKPVFSILHATARLPLGWVDSYRAWSNLCGDRAKDYEYVLAVHESDYDRLPLEWLQLEHENPTGIPLVVIKQTGRYCSVDNWNAAATVAEGEVLVLGQDDIFPCEDWDLKLLEALANIGSCGAIVHVSTGSPRDDELISSPVMTRALYERWGYFWYPDYESMYCDDDLTVHAYEEGVVIRALHILFEHRNPILKGTHQDDVFKHENRPEAYKDGLALFQKRKRAGFNTTPIRDLPKRKAVLAMCVPGISFSMQFLSAWTRLYDHVSRSDCIPAPFFGYSSNVFHTRASMWNTLRMQPRVDYILMLDDDNILEPEQLNLLMQDLRANPDLDGVVGWCLVQSDFYAMENSPSVGSLIGPGISKPYTLKKMRDPSQPDLIPIGYSGFPAVLLRGSLLQKVPGNPFRPILSDNISFGMSSEDVSFFQRMQDAGCKFSVDRRVEVPHFKFRPVAESDISYASRGAKELSDRVKSSKGDDNDESPSPSSSNPTDAVSGQPEPELTTKT